MHLPLRPIFRQSHPNLISVRTAYASKIWAQLTKNLLAKSSTKRFREYIRLKGLKKENCCRMLIKKRKNTVPPWKIFILTVVGFGLMLAIASHSRDEALNRLNQEYTITDEGKPRHIKFESMPVGEAEQAVGMYLRYNAMAQYEESEKLLSADQTKNVPFDVMKADFENGIYPLDVLVHGFKTLSEEEYGEEKSLYDNQATLLGYTSYKVVQVSLDEQWPDEIKENVTRQYAVGRSRKNWKIFAITEK